MTTGRRKNDPLDVYETPDEAIEPFLKQLSEWRIDAGASNLARSAILEPCAGSGSILKHLPYRDVYAWDIEPKAEGIQQQDFLSIQIPPCFDVIITNPPFSKAQEFVDKARNLIVKDGQVAMLLRLAFLESQTRRDWWLANMPQRVYVLSKRPSFTGKGTDSAAYGWFVWGTEGAHHFEGHIL